MKCSSSLGFMSSSVILHPVVGPLCVDSSVFRATTMGSLVHSSTTCLADKGARLQSRGLGGFSGLALTRVSSARSLAIALAERWGMCAVGSNDFVIVFLSRLAEVLHFSMQFRHGIVLSPLSVDLAQLQSGSLSPCLATVSACSCPLMLMCDGVHFPLILQPRCC